MNNIDHAHALIKLAQADLKALTGMTNPDVFTDAIFGFHAQQAVEKGLKSWLAYLDVLFPLTHDLSRLIPLLEKHGEDVDDLWQWISLTPFAVEHRYSWPESEDEILDREVLVAQITALLASIQSKIYKLTQ